MSMPVGTSTLAERYRLANRWKLILVCLLFICVMLTFIIDMATGPASLPLRDVLQGLFQSDKVSGAVQVIIWNVRLPQALMAIVVGACLGLAGAEMQTALNNPLASPFTLGIGAAATFGASLVIVLHLNVFGLPNTIMMPLAAFVAAALAAMLILTLSRYFGASVHTVVLFGIALLFGINALVGLLQFVADADAVQQVVFWTMGSLGRANIQEALLVSAVFLLMFPWAMRQSWSLTALLSGEEQAQSLGIHVQRLRLIVLLRVSLLTAVALAFVGEIGFIGLVAPHIARLCLGEDHRFFLPGSALAGALLLSLSSIASKTLIPGILIPVGIITALVGIPLFIALIIRRGRVL